ncbi:hypothetical protein ACH5RR_007300 [Cinchona calisaya]|uniref:HTH three-helical bundle domain-containing protein n=1 Tax=Cinchona calisaya TaxID=153742 RepID=A0ABD3ARV5_9GENT
MEAFVEFPSPVEREVASALLLLAAASASSSITTPPPPPPYKMERMKMRKKKKKKNLLRFKISKSQPQRSSSSSSSTVTTSEKGDQEPQRMKVIAVVSKFHEMMKLKKNNDDLIWIEQVVKKRRSRNLIISDCQKFSSGGKQPMKVAEEPSASSVSAASSCLSTGSISSSGSCRTGDYLFVTPAATTTKDLNKRKPVLGSGHMRRRADAILKVLSSHGCASEIKIRELLGDSPSTSKALRILLNLEQVKRSGAGGRTDPYIYMTARMYYHPPSNSEEHHHLWHHNRGVNGGRSSDTADQEITSMASYGIEAFMDFDVTDFNSLFFGLDRHTATN